MKNIYQALSRQPISLEANRVWRTYKGGKKLEEWQGSAAPRDGDFPEDWVASAVKANNAGREDIPEEGLSKIEFNGQIIPLREVIRSDPETFLGVRHVSKYGNDPGMLVKVLDSGCRLSIQVHPDKAFAEQVFHSKYGKTEAWLVLGSRKIAGEEPYLLLGFKPGMTKERWKGFFDRQDIPAMIAGLHHFPVLPNTVFFIEGGVPHAIGPGCFLIEIQEPTDYTIRTERTTTDGKPIPDRNCHQGAGFDRALEAFHYEGYSYEETLRRWQIRPKALFAGENAAILELIGPAHTDKFRLHRLVIHSGLECPDEGVFSVLIVLSGSGTIVASGGRTGLNQGDRFFLPAGMGDFEIRAGNCGELNLVRCYPPQ